MDPESVLIPDRVPVFPLPQVVLFPRAVLPLHVFEQRYREMTGDALAGDGFMAVALLKPGFEALYYTLRAPIHPVVGVGKIVASEKLDDGRFNILLQGLARMRIAQEESGELAYRVARVERLAAAGVLSPACEREIRAGLKKALRELLGLPSELLAHWLELCDANLPLGDTVDLIASGLSCDAELRQCLLAEACAMNRACALREQLATLGALCRQRMRRTQRGDCSN